MLQIRPSKFGGSFNEICFLDERVMNMVEMKKLGMESYDAILDFDKLCFPTDCWKEEDWKDLLEDERATYYAFVEGNKIVGDLFTYNWSGEDDYLKIMNIAVHPDYRKQGLAMKLMEYAKEEYKESDLKKICAETRASNTAMQTVFEKCGYSLNKVEENGYSNPPEDEYKYVYTDEINLV